MSIRPAIPLKIKREVRQRCGFGCVICGSPLYEYEHMVEWSKTHHHKSDELTLLCSRHHAERTKKLLPAKRVKEANDRPFNLSAGVSSPQSLYYDGNSFKLKLGDSVSTYTGLKDGQTFSPFAIDGKPVISFTNDSGNILLNIELKDESGNIILLVDSSELIYSIGLWDVEWVGQTLTIREGMRKIFLELEFAPPDMVSINRGSLHYNGIEIEIGNDYIFCLNNRLLVGNCAVHGMGYGFALGDPVPNQPCGYVFSGIPRPVVDRDKAIQYMTETLEKMREEKIKRRPNENKFRPISIYRNLMLSGSYICYSFIRK